MTTYAVLCSCMQRPCLMCARAGATDSFLFPMHSGVRLHIATKETAFCNRAARPVDGPPAHRYDVAELRADGWPRCPWCGEDELYSLATPASAEKLDGCYRCGTKPPAGETR